MYTSTRFASERANLLNYLRFDFAHRPERSRGTAEILELHPVGDSTESAGDGVSSHALV